MTLSLRHKLWLMLAGVLVTLVAGLLLALLLASRYSERAVASAGEAYLARQAEAFLGRQGLDQVALLDNRLALVELLTRDLVRQIEANGSAPPLARSSLIKRSSAALSAVANGAPPSLTFFCAFRQGVFIATRFQQPIVQHLGQSLLPAEWWAISSPPTVRWDSPRRLSVLHQEQLAVATLLPLGWEAEQEGVCGVSIALADLTYELNQSQATRGSYSFLIDDAGNLLAAPPQGRLELAPAAGSLPASLLTPGIAPAVTAAVRAMQGGQSDLVRLMLHGEEKYIAYRALGAINWRLGLVSSRTLVTAPAAELRRTLRRTGELLLGAVLASTLVLLPLSWLLGTRFSGRLTRPLDAMAQHAREMAAGNYTVRVAVDSDDEIGQLATAFNEMADRLHANVRELAIHAAIIDATTDLVLITRVDGGIQYCNRAAQKLYPPSAQPDCSLLWFSAESRLQLQVSILPALQDNAVWSGEQTLQLPSGETLPVSAVLLALRDEQGRIEFIAWLLRDIQLQKADEAALQEQEQALRRLIAALPVGVLVTDPSGHPEYANPIAEALLGVDVCNTDLAHFVAEQRILRAGANTPYPLEALPLTRALKGHAARADDIELVHADRRLPLEVTATPLYTAAGGLQHAILVLQDITQRRQDERELELYRDHLEQLVARRTEALQARIQFEDMLARQSTRFLSASSEDMGAVLTNALSAIGRFFAVDRCYISLNVAGNGANGAAYRWQTPDLPGKPATAAATAHTRLALWAEQLSRHESIVLDSLDKLPASAKPAREALAAAGVHSLLLIRLKASGRFLGMMGFDALRAARQWEDADLPLFKLAGELFACAIHNHDQRQALEATQAQLLAANQRLAELASHDGLTGLANRRCFDETLADELARAMRHQRPLALLLLDIDYFKAYNDHYGHVNADAVLTRISSALRQTFQRTGELPARYGGEEFAVILPQATEDDAWQAAERLQAAIAALAIEHTYSTVGPRLTVSVGLVSLIPPAETQAEQLIRAADAALYKAKHGGRNRITVYSGPPPAAGRC